MYLKTENRIKKPFGKKVALIFEFFSECSYIVLTNQ